MFSYCLDLIFHANFPKGPVTLFRVSTALARRFCNFPERREITGKIWYLFVKLDLSRRPNSDQGVASEHIEERFECKRIRNRWATYDVYAYITHMLRMRTTVRMCNTWQCYCLTFAYCWRKFICYVKPISIRKKSTDRLLKIQASMLSINTSSTYPQLENMPI